MSVHPLLFLESPIVQIDDYESLLLVSNTQKCLLCNLDYEDYKQVLVTHNKSLQLRFIVFEFNNLIKFTPLKTC